MTEKAFLELPDDERLKILNAMSAELGRGADILEKDVWVCWALEHLWAARGDVRMAFKGGTSLSKAYRAIERFSEDIDVTIDYRSLCPELNPFAKGVSRTKLKKAGERLKERVGARVRDTIVPRLQAALDTSGSGTHVEASDDGESVRIYYRSVSGGPGGYIADSVLLEFGGRNTTEPNVIHALTPDLAQKVPKLRFPSPKVNVLCAKRTFWEKATMMHAESNRERLRENANRLSRHWYDVYVLSDHHVGKQALADRALLEDVIRHKEVFFHASYASYEACLEGCMRLLPEAEGCRALARDYEEMQKAGMFYGASPTFDRIVERITELQTTINAGG